MGTKEATGGIQPEIKLTYNLVVHLFGTHFVFLLRRNVLTQYKTDIKSAHLNLGTLNATLTPLFDLPRSFWTRRDCLAHCLAPPLLGRTRASRDHLTLATERVDCAPRLWEQVASHP